VTTVQFAALTPADGDEVHLVVDATAGIVWHLRYNAGSASSYKWEFLGGAALFSEVATAEGTAAAYADLATVGPSIVLPRAGDYIVAHGFDFLGATGGANGYMSYQIGATAAVDADAVEVADDGTSWTQASVSREQLKTGLTAVTLTAKYKGSGNNARNRWMRVTPRRIS
jgi:hypothetical protein